MNTLSIAELKKMRTTYYELQYENVVTVLDELIAIRELDGDPVAYTSERWLDTRCKLPVWTDRDSAIAGVGDNSNLVELFTAPQKPVVLEAKCDDDGTTTSEFDMGWNAYRDAAIEAAGGKVIVSEK